MVNPDELDQTTAPAPSRRETGPTAVAACYDRRIHRVVVRLNTGLEVAFKPHDAPGLEAATLDDLSVIEIRPSAFQRVKWKLSKYQQSEASTMGDAVGDAVSDG